MNVETVYIIDQDPDDIELLNEAVREIIPGVKVNIAQSCDTFVEKIKQENPDLVFLETYLPPENAERCLEVVRKTPTCQNAIVVMLSGYHTKKQAEYYLRKGANYIFEKPSSYRELKRIIEKLLSRKTQHVPKFV